MTNTADEIHDTHELADPPRVVLLAGGTGGAKLARGLVDLLGSNLTVVSNVADDIDIYGAHVSPDPDLCCYWLSHRVDPRGWGIADDTFTVMDELRALGEDIWFNLGDRDMAVCIQRAQWLAQGVRPTEAIDRLRRRLGIPAQILPPTDDRLRTTVKADGIRSGVQEFLIARGGVGAINDVTVTGLEEATVTPEVLAAIKEADVIVIGPSNPALSIRPILHLPGMREAIATSVAPVVTVSPLVRGAVLKGPTAAFLDHLGVPHDATGIARVYEGIVDGVLSDESHDALPSGIVHRQADVLLDRPNRRRAVAAEVLALADTVRAGA